MDPRWKEGKEGVAPRFIPIGSKEPMGAASLVVGLQLPLGRIWASSWPKRRRSAPSVIRMKPLHAQWPSQLCINILCLRD